jgi:hypothetical protein
MHVFPHNSGQSRNVFRFETGVVAKPTGDLHDERIIEHRLFFGHRGCCACILELQVGGPVGYTGLQGIVSTSASRSFGHGIPSRGGVPCYFAAVIWSLEISETHLKSFVWMHLRMKSLLSDV